MKRYNLSQIMKAAHTMRKFRPAKYPTFSIALKTAWKVAKFNKEIADRKAETMAYHEARKKEAQEHAERIARIEAERMAFTSKDLHREEKVTQVEADCQAYGYGRSNHYSSFSGWGNYCGD